MRWIDTRLRFAALATVAALALHGTALGQLQSESALGCAQDVVDWSPGGGSLACDIQTTEYQAVGQANATANGTTGLVDVQADLTLFNDEYMGPALILANAEVRLYFTLVEKKTPPGGSVQVPVRIESAGEMSLSGTATGSGFACIAATFACSDPLGELGGAQGATSFSDSRVIYPSIGKQVLIRKSALVNVRAQGGGGSAQMVIDPEVSLDQAAFDEAQGDATFVLADYYEIATFGEDQPMDGGVPGTGGSGGSAEGPSTGGTAGTDSTDPMPGENTGNGGCSVATGGGHGPTSFTLLLVVAWLWSRRLAMRQAPPSHSLV